MVAACGGGGGGDPAAPAAGGGAVVLPEATGNFADSGSVLPDPATTAQPITITVNVTFSGSVSPASNKMRVPVVISQAGAVLRDVDVDLVQTLGTLGTGSFAGTVQIVLPPQTQGLQTFGIQIDPKRNMTVNGNVPGIAYGSAVINP